MIVWSGRGFLSVLVLIATLFLCVTILPKEHSDYGFVIALFIAGTFSWIFGNKWNNSEARTVIDEKTGQKFILKSNHSLFWLKMEYWGLIFGIIGIVILFQNSIIAAIITAIILLAIVVFIYFNQKKISPEPQTIRKKPETPIAEKQEPVETEEERQKRRLEKEDPSRFMPK